MAFFETLFRDQRVLAEPDRAYELLGRSLKQFNIAGGGGTWSVENQEANKNALKGFFAPAFAARGRTDPARRSWASDIEQVLLQSRTENSAYDFKQGLCRLEERLPFDEICLLGCFETIAALANLGPGAKEYLLIGVADRRPTAERHRQITGRNYFPYADFFITGIDAEADNSFGDIDKYWTFLSQRLRDAQISEPTRSEVANNMRCVKFHERSLLIFDVKGGVRPTSFAGKYFDRELANTVEVYRDRLFDLFKRFP